MFRSWVMTSCLGVVLLPVVGCKSTKADMDTVLITVGLKSKDPDLKPPPQPEQYNLPPEDDSRFSKVVTYPDGTLNQDLVKKKPDQLGGPGGPGGSMGAGGPGMGGGMH